MNEVIKAVKEMYGTNNLDDFQRIVKINDSLEIEINVRRWGDSPDDPEAVLEFDMNGNFVGVTDDPLPPPGMVLETEMYAIKNGEAVDCITFGNLDNLEEDVRYLINCYK